MTIDFQSIQEFLKEENMDGWLLYDFHGKNDVAIEFLHLPGHITRRSFFFIPAVGEPVALVSHIEKDRFRHLGVRIKSYASYRGMESLLKEVLGQSKIIAMEYSPNGRLPYIGLVDAGTIEMVRSIGIEIVSSANIVANFQARITEAQIDLHRKAAFMINHIKDDAFRLIRKSLVDGNFINEKMVVYFIKRRFEEEDLTTDFPPICAVNANICNPHYEPTEGSSSPIRENSLILIDLWGKCRKENAVFADITWMAYAGESIPDEYGNLFSIVVSARDAAVRCLKEKFPAEPVYGYEVDDVCRGVIEAAGYGENFFHRTGHSILENVHGPGPNIDNRETEDKRRLLPGHLFSIEPGIYLEEYGFRSEIDCMLTEAGPEITTQPVQKDIIALLM
ncbi:MAG: aminopeptidase P family protein [Candidatus Zixiibacteriota bacterium]|nr:MAG: aminopeptidase P family protein [candidate division Zixibacteria bacterium]